MLELAPKLTAAMDNLGSLQAPQICNKLLFSISPYLAPEVSLIELSQKAQVIKRLPPPIMYQIEPLPDKISIEVERGDSREQALLGDPYEIKIKFAKKDNIKLESLEAVFMDFSTLPGAFDESQSVHSSMTAYSGFQDESLTHGVPDGKQSTGPGARESLFNSSMAQFYQLARSTPDSAIAGRSAYIGADPSLGVAVKSKKSISAVFDSQVTPVTAPINLRAIKSPDARSPVAGGGPSIQNAFTQDFLTHIAEKVEEDFEPIELYSVKKAGGQTKEKKIPIMARDHTVKTLPIGT